MSKDAYPALIRPLSEDEGGGWLVEYPDLPGCMSDGETPEEALKHGKEAIAGWIKLAREMGRSIPKPGSSVGGDNPYSGKWLQRVPKSLHRKLVEGAKREGVSLNTLCLTLLAEGVGFRLKKDDAA